MDSIPPSPLKRKRQDLTDEVKQAICAYKKDHPSTSQEKIAEAIQNKYNLYFRPGRSTISDILKEREKWQNMTNASSTTFRHNAGKYPQLEQALSIWIADKVSVMIVYNFQLIITGVVNNFI